jgi:hypothetical protein
MTDSQFHQIILAELKESNRLMKAMVSELSQIKFELVNERLRREREKEMRIKEAEQRPLPPAFSYTIPIPVKSGTPGIDGTSDITMKTDTPSITPSWKRWLAEQLAGWEK